MIARSWIALVALALACSVARADSDAERARAYYRAGVSDYNLGDYQAALREFTAGYKLSPRPQFLVNLGQVYRRLGELEKARDMYERFLSEAAEDDRARAQVRELVAEVERAIAARDAERAATVTGPPVAAPPPIVDDFHPRPHEKPFLRRHWWIFPASAVVIAGVAVGIYFGTRPSAAGPDCASASLGCLDLRH